MIFDDLITKVRQSIGLKMSYGLRAFTLYILILGGLGWFVLSHAMERLADGMRQAAENVMVDSVNIIAAMLEQQTQNGESLNTDLLASTMANVKQRVLLAKIYQVDKFSVSARLYVTNKQGIVIYDSTGRDTGKDYSQWRDVNLTLAGEYGARTSFINEQQSKKSAGAPKTMIVAAPITYAGKILGAVSLATPINSLDQHLETEAARMQESMLLGLGTALFLGFLLSLLFSRSIGKIATYADKMANGEHVSPPKLLDQRLADLSNSVANLRTQLDGKEYVEDYIHGLTHELKTPITSIHGAVELIAEGLPPNEQTKFLKNIDNSNQRMSRLVERMLNLAKLEGQTRLIDNGELDLTLLTKRLMDERHQAIHDKGLTIEFTSQGASTATGDSVLISQAIANLLDNALRFAERDSTLTVRYNTDNNVTKFEVLNQGELIPDYALSRIFERFFSLPSANQPDSNNKSTGLGLSFVYEIMKLHRGRVIVENDHSGVKAQLSWPADQASS